MFKQLKYSSVKISGEHMTRQTDNSELLCRVRS